MKLLQISIEDHVNKVHQIKDLTKGGKCSQCGGCCGNSLDLTDKEIKEIKHYIKANNIKPSTVVSPLLRVRAYDNTCPFLDHSKKTEKCKIYSVRPSICRAFICHNMTVNNILQYPEYVFDSTRRTINVRATFFPK